MSTDRSAWHAVSPQTALETFGVQPDKGLSEAQAAESLKINGFNELPKSKRDPAWKVLLSQFLNPLVLALLAAAVIATVVAFLEGDKDDDLIERYANAGAILAIVILNAIIGFIQERKAERALDSLQAMLVFNARVFRDGAERLVPSREVVPGEIVVMEAGDNVPADVRLLHTADFQANESTLTGESTPVAKDAQQVLDSTTAMADRSNMGFMGTMAVRGRARGVVIATGSTTEIGRIGKVIGELRSGDTPLEKRMATFSRQILVVCLVISVILFALGTVRHEESVSNLFLIAVALAVAAIPEGLPAVTTITLALGMQRMSRRGALIRNLPAVETLGSATVICTDKTGTLTQNDMQVREVCTLRSTYRVEGGWRLGEGQITLEGERVIPGDEPDLLELLEAAVVPNHVAVRDDDQGNPKGEGDPTEVAIVLLGVRLGILREEVLANMTLVASNPFDSDRRRMSLVFRTKDSTECISFVKGGVEEIIQRCSFVLDDNGPRPILADDRTAIHQQVEHMAQRALRVLAIARRRRAPEKAEEAESELEFLGLVGMQDPPRPEAIDAIRECKDAGIRVVMITGDHAVTARAIAVEMGMWEEGDLVLTGPELEKTSDEELVKLVPHVRIFARVTAEQKLRIVRAWKADGGVIAMTGDGVNDAPALREADIGVAMGKGGTDVARDAAKMVLTDNNFASIVHAVSEGRTILRNIRKSVVFLLSSNAGLVITVIACAFFPETLLILMPIQLLWINLVTNGAPALGLGVDTPEPDHMKLRPRPVNAGLLDREDALFIAGIGVVMGALGIVIYLLPDWLTPATATPTGARTLAFAYLAFAPLFHVFNCRGRRVSIFSKLGRSNWFLWLAVAASAMLMILALLVPAFHKVFGVEPLVLRDWAIVMAIAFAILPLWEGVKAILRLKERRG